MNVSARCLIDSSNLSFVVPISWLGEPGAVLQGPIRSLGVFEDERLSLDFRQIIRIAYNPGYGSRGEMVWSNGNLRRPHGDRWGVTASNPRSNSQRHARESEKEGCGATCLPSTAQLVWLHQRRLWYGKVLVDSHRFMLTEMKDNPLSCGSDFTCTSSGTAIGCCSGTAAQNSYLYTSCVDGFFMGGCDAACEADSQVQKWYDP